MNEWLSTNLLYSWVSSFIFLNEYNKCNINVELDVIYFENLLQCFQVNKYIHKLGEKFLSNCVFSN